MTDFEKLISMKVNFKVNEPIIEKHLPNAKRSVTIFNSNAFDGGPLGYGGFFSEWFFDENDNLLGVAHWE